ncbi:peptidoglycan bridge formation glycyltransferase FemA/FemB family protein [Patescibacteria group bacterium]|nr:peptidoglycan bridge formation glycyltransferase FemA/FemB family protein [Patescibacteria group bacterium]
MLKIEEIKGKKIWEDFLLGCEEKTFLQSWNWGEFQKMMKNKVWRFGVYDGGDLVGVTQVFKIEAKRGTFLFVPHGPILRIKNEKLKIKNYNSKFKKEILNTFLEELKRIAKRENCGFVRVAAIWERIEENEKIFKDLGFREAPMHIHPEVTWELNLEKSEEELLMDMRKTTRYLIRQGLKNEELKIEKSQNPEDIEVFNNLYQKTVDRHHFVPFSLNYLKNEFLAFLPDGQVLIFLAKYKGECLASSLIIFWQGIAFYHQGASVKKYPKIPVSYLLQWETIKEAKTMGCKLYNFWGIAETESKKHPFWGLSLFKKGFGGYEKRYVKTQDLPLSFKYWLTFAFEVLRRKRRGF